jgi:hypothetical protein
MDMHMSVSAFVCRQSYVEGRLRLAERERLRLRNKTEGATGGTAAKADAAAAARVSDLAQAEAAADANMAALLEEETASAVSALCNDVRSSLDTTYQQLANLVDT